MGNFLDTQFTTDAVHGLRSAITPYFGNPFAWTGPDKSIAFVLTSLSEYWVVRVTNPGHQIALLVRAGSLMTDVIYQFPGDVQLTTSCELCADGTLAHELKITRITNGWALFVDGVQRASETCTCLANDKLSLAHNQVPVVMEMASGITQNLIDRDFRFAKSWSLDYLTSLGTWKVVPKARAYYTKQSGTNFDVGDVQPELWAAVDTDGPFTTKTGTTTYLIRYGPGVVLWQ